MSEATGPPAAWTPLELPALRLVRSSRLAAQLAIGLGLTFAIVPVVLLLAPWTQNIPGTGRVVAFSPTERPQSVDAPINGRVVRWYVHENDLVEEGQIVADLADIDPQFLQRLQDQLAFAQAQLAAAENEVRQHESQIINLESTRDMAVAAATNRLEAAQERVRAIEQQVNAQRDILAATGPQLERHKQLLKDGIVSQRQLELAQMEHDVAARGLDLHAASLRGAQADVQAAEAEISRIRADAQARIDATGAALQTAKGRVESARSAVVRAESDLKRQEAQHLAAPMRGRVFRIAGGQGGEIVRIGDRLMDIVPETGSRAVEVWVSGNDAPLIEVGRHVRIQFEGWPAIQFVGWPSAAVGTFGGIVSLVDATDDGKGRFRLLVTPDPNDEPWPAERFLRQGVRAKAWVLLNDVTIGFELWRQLNGFPPVIAPAEPKDDIARKRIK